MPWADPVVRNSIASMMIGRRHQVLAQFVIAGQRAEDNEVSCSDRPEQPSSRACAGQSQLPQTNRPRLRKLKPHQCLRGEACCNPLAFILVLQLYFVSFHFITASYISPLIVYTCSFVCFIYQLSDRALELQPSCCPQSSSGESAR